MADSNFLYYTEVLSQPDLKFMSLLNANFQKRVETEKEEFLSIAKDAGQEVDLLLQDGECITYYRIDTMPEARRILSQATLEERKKRSETFLDGLEYRSRIPQGMHDRGEAYVFADHPLEAEKDQVGHRNHLPIYVRTWSILEKTVRPGEVWDVTLHPSEFGVDEKEEMYNILNVGRLILQGNASVLVRGNAFVFTCQQIVKEGASGSEYDIGILGTPHGFGMRRGLFDGRDGKHGMQAKNGSDGTKPVLGMSF